jgi:hypothetical protein
MAIEDYLPNVFGSSAPSYLQGLLGAEETQKLQGRANVQGLLGAGLALAQGMSRTGPRRSAAENILGALSGGFGAAGGAYDQGIKNYVTQQQIAQTQLAQQDALLKRQQTQAKLDQIKAIEKEDPALARLLMINEAEGAKQLALKQQLSGFNLTGKETAQELEAIANKVYAAGVPGLKPYGDSLMAKAKQLAIMPPKTDVAPVDQPAADAAAQTTIDTTKPALPPVEDTARRGKVSQIQSGLDYIDNELARVMKVEPTQENINYQNSLRANREVLAKQQELFSVMEYDFTDLKGLPSKYQTEVKQLQKQAEGGVLDKTGLNSRIERIYTRLQEDERGRKLDGNAATFAQMKFGVTDRAQLTGPQLAEVLRFENAPTADQLGTLQREAIRLRAEKGVQAPIPAGRDSMLYAPTQRTTTQPVTQTSPVAQPTTAQPVATRPVATAPSAAIAQVSPEAVPQQAPRGAYSVVIAGKPVNFNKINQDALINKPENILPLVDRQKLEQAKPATESLTRYTLRNVVDAKTSAESLLSNDRYLEALSSRAAKLKSSDIFGYQIDQETMAANELLQNLLTRSFVTSLQEMRAASPTGGAVGQVAVAEMEALSRIQAAIKLGMPKAELMKQLQQYINVSERTMRDLPLAFGKTYTYQGEFNDILESNIVPQKETVDNLSTEGRRAYEKYRPRRGQ